jgi:hypothetical protein
MAYIVISDEGPNAEDYENNYIFFDGSNPHTVAEIEQLFLSKGNRDSAFYSELEKVCKSSLQPKKIKHHFMIKMLGSFLRDSKQITR